MKKVTSLKAVFGHEQLLISYLPFLSIKAKQKLSSY